MGLYNLSILSTLNLLKNLKQKEITFIEKLKAKRKENKQQQCRTKIYNQIVKFSNIIMMFKILIKLCF